MSSTLAAGGPPTITVLEPFTTVPGPPGTHPAKTQGIVLLPTLAAGKFPISTVGAPDIIGKGIAGCETGVGLGAGG